MKPRVTLRRYMGKIPEGEFQDIVGQVRETRTLSNKAYTINHSYFVRGDMQVDIAAKEDCSGPYVNKICKQFLSEYLEYAESNSHGQER